MKPGLYIFTGNRLEILARALAELMTSRHRESGNPLEPEWIVVQSKGMQRWLSMVLADLDGAIANIKFPFPNQLLDYLALRSGLQDGGQIGVNDPDPWDPEVLVLRVLDLLDTMIDEPAGIPLKRYLEPDFAELKKFQLAKSIAHTFDQYQVFRPQLLKRWEKGKQGSLKDEQWQAELWRALVSRCPAAHRERRRQLLLERLKSVAEREQGLPSRLSVFGISHLPPFHLEIFQALSKIIPVYLFLFNPCRVYWADILSPLEQERLSKRYSHSTTNRQELHFFSGNRLLSLWGGMGRAFFEQVSELEGIQTDLFTDGEGGSVLEKVQQDILELSEGQGQGKGGLPNRDDTSIQVHVCHSPMRELEVLYDNLADLLASDPDLTCNDILVMTPELDKYAPLIHAVFGHQETGRPRLAYTVADKDDFESDATVRTFFRILDLPNGRMEASRVLELLECDSVCAKFGIDHETRANLPEWIAEAGIRWGIDADDRASRGFAADESNTWIAGLDRLVLGSAMVPEFSLVGGILPCQQVQGAKATGLGRIIALFDTLSQITRLLRGAWTGTRWAVILRRVIDWMFADGGSAGKTVSRLQEMISHWENCLAIAGFDSELPLEVVTRMLADKVRDGGVGAGFLSNGITFCAMLPMRSIPAKVICLLGMGQECFPRSSHRPGFDLLQSAPKPWDRNRRLDDMYLFLESLLSARKVFYVSYVGRSIHDDTTIAPSEMVNQLLEYLAVRFGRPADHWVTVHRLHGFAPEYFNGESPRLFSFSQQDCLACRAAMGQKKNPPPMLEAISLPAPSDKWKSLTLREMEDFFEHPGRFLLQNRLGIRFPRPRRAVEDKENFSLKGLDRYRVSQIVLEGRIRGIDHQYLKKLVRAQGLLPHGCMARTSYQALAAEADLFLERLNQITDPGDGAEKRFSLVVRDFKISGRLSNLYPKGQIIYRFAKLRPKDLMCAFIRHLFFQLTGSDSGSSPQTWLMGPNQAWRFKPLDDPEPVMESFLGCYWQGLMSPLPYILEVSMDYARRIIVANQSPPVAREGALKKLKPYNIKPMEARDPYLDCCFGPDPEFDSRFAELSLAVFGPLWEWVEKMELG